MRGHVLAAASEMTSTTTRATTMASWSASPTYPPESTSRIRACDAGISSEGVRRTITLASGGRRVALTERSLVPRDHGPSVLPAVPDLRRLRDAETSDTPERPTIAEMIDRYLAWKAGKAAENTVKTYTAGLKW